MFLPESQCANLNAMFLILCGIDELPANDLVHVILFAFIGSHTIQSKSRQLLSYEQDLCVK